LNDPIRSQEEGDNVMRFALATLVLLAAAATTPASAQMQHDPYRWCADYAGFRGLGATNCWFMTIEQCRAAVSGVGGYCTPNPFYTGPEQRPRRKRQ
jgi:hypothetical protein